MTPLTEAQFRSLVERFVREESTNLTTAAHAIGVSEYTLHEFLNGNSRPEESIAAHFGLRPQVVYVRVGEEGNDT